MGSIFSREVSKKWILEEDVWNFAAASEGIFEPSRPCHSTVLMLLAGMMKTLSCPDFGFRLYMGGNQFLHEGFFKVLIMINTVNAILYRSRQRLFETLPILGHNLNFLALRGERYIINPYLGINTSIYSPSSIEPLYLSLLQPTHGVRSPRTSSQ